MERQQLVTRAALESVVKLRKLADSDASRSEVEVGYGGVIISVASLYNQVGGIGDNARAAGWTLYTIAMNRIGLTSQRSVLSSAVEAGKLNVGQQANVLSSQLVRDITAMDFQLYASQGEVDSFQAATESEPSRRLVAAVHTLNGSTAAVSLDKFLPASWYEDMTRLDGELKQLQTRVEDRIVAAAREQKQEARDQVVLDAVIAGLVLVLAALIVALTSRHLVRGLRWLRTSAVRVADEHLPEVTRHLSAGQALPEALEGRVLKARTRDELGDVARAFDQVYLEAVRLAREQASIRKDVNLFFQNLSRRNQALVHKQLSLITELEHSEREPGELSKLFQLDHLATRIRRNSENLLVLAGAEISAERRETTGLLDLLRTAASEIEEYQRVTCHAIPDTGVAGYAADDLVHLLAELLDNATSFSSPDTWVVVSGQQTPDGRVLLEVRDSGIGMSESQLAAAREVLDPAVRRTGDLSESMGLYVVSSLAHKHGAEIRLYPNLPTGLVAALVLPQGLLGPVGAPPAQDPAPARLTAHRPPVEAARPDTVPIRQVRAAVPAPAPAPAPVQVPEPGPGPGPAATLPAAAPAAAASPAPPLTESGLPVRNRRVRSGSFGEGPQATPQGATHPDPAEIRRRMKVLSEGIANAAAAAEDEHRA